MRIRFIFLALSLAFVCNQGAPLSECCDKKLVGDVEYVLKMKGDTSAYNCVSDCLYEKVNLEGTLYCFAIGNLTVKCEDIDTTELEEIHTTKLDEIHTTQLEEIHTTQLEVIHTTQEEEIHTTQLEEIHTTQLEEIPNTQGCVCGRKKTSRIVGGQETEVNEYPWMVALATPQDSFYCGGTLIASEWVVTASHCLFYEDVHGTNIPYDPVSELRIVLGEHDISSTTESIIPRKVVNVSKQIMHPSFNTTTKNNDIALIKLANAVDLNVYTPACLPDTGDDFTGKKAWVYGWGDTSFGGEMPTKLQELEVGIVSDAVCKAAFEDIGWTIGNDTDGMLCAGGVEGEDPCNGDSGGPLTVDIDGHHTLVGIVNFGYYCAKGLYAVYAETAVYRAWIDATVAGEGGASNCPV